MANLQIQLSGIGYQICTIMESEVIVMNKTKVKFTRFEKIVIFTMLGLAASFIAAFFVLRYIVLNVSFAP